MPVDWFPRKKRHKDPQKAKTENTGKSPADSKLFVIQKSIPPLFNSNYYTFITKNNATKKGNIIYVQYS